MAHSSWTVKESSIKELFRKIRWQGLGKSVVVKLVNSPVLAVVGRHHDRSEHSIFFYLVYPKATLYIQLSYTPLCFLLLIMSAK